MTVKLNQQGLRQARSLVRDGKVVRDERDDWSEDAPTPDEENSFIEEHGWAETADGISASTTTWTGRPRATTSSPTATSRRCTGAA